MKIFNKISVVSLIVPLVISLSGQAVFAASPATVNLGTAGNFVILAKTGISTTGSTLIVGDLGVSPAAASYITGFGLILPYASAFSTSALVNGKIYAPGYANPTPANLTTAVLDMQNAYTDAAGRAPDFTELGAGNIGGLTLAPGVYKWGTNVTIPTDVILSGGANDAWIFQIAQNLNISSATKVMLAGGAQAANIFWQVAGQVTLGTTSTFNGNILGQTAIVLNTGALLNGRALAQTAVTLDSNSVTIPTSSSSVAPAPVVPATPAISAIPATPSSGTSPSVTSTGSVQAISATPAVSATPASPSATQATSQTQLPAQASPVAVAIHAFNAALKLGSTGTDVTELQKRLAAEGIYSGPITGYFGSLTQAAVKKYQANYGIDQLGNVGPSTRAQLNKALVSGVSQAPTTTGRTVESLQNQLQVLQMQLLQLLNQQLQNLKKK